jgi:hypothetical protein
VVEWRFGSFQYSEWWLALLEKPIEDARKEIASHGYYMSVGELLDLYRDDGLRQPASE